MTGDSNVVLFSWGAGTFGLNKSKGENILYKDDDILMVNANDSLEYVCATYNFDPKQLPASLQKQFDNLNALVIGNFGTYPTVKFNQIPSWLARLPNIKMLSLVDVDLSNLIVLSGLPITHIDFNKIQFAEASSLIEAIYS
ncbi:MAG: hypothetical protein WDO14_13825 [Bacteroidota bacterium]